MSTRHHHRIATIATIATSLAALGSLASCTADDELGFDDFIDETELRMAMLASPDPLPQAALDTIDATLPEGQDAPATHPSLFPTGFDPNPEVIAANTDVWVTFAREGSSYDSVMGFFTYPTGNPPASLTAQELEDGVILSGTESRSNGERWHLGTFQPGVQVGFFLVRGGACSSGATCNTTVGADFTQPILYSVDSMNPEYATNPLLSRHMIVGDLVDDLAPDARVLAWEEKERNTGFSDDDFNDLVVRVTATPALGGDAPPPVGSNAYRIDCLDILENGESVGDGHYTIDPDGSSGPVAPFLVYCDMTTDGGGWTLFGRGYYTDDLNGSTIDPSTNDALLEPARLGALLAIGNRVFRHQTTTGEELYVVDDAPIFDTHYWRTAGDVVTCSNDVGSTDSGMMTPTGTRSVDCDSLGVGTHQCGHSSGWILTHNYEPLGEAIHNADGEHPCPVGGTLESVWMRRNGAPLPVIRQDCQDYLERGESRGDGMYVIDPDGAGAGVPPFDVHCDMTTDGGGWTLLGRGRYQQSSSLRPTPTTDDELLEPTRIASLMAIGDHFFRARTHTGGRVYIVDSQPVFSSHIWRSNAPTVQCANDLGTLASSPALVSTKALSCDPSGFGAHQCGGGNGWILTHNTPDMASADLTYNVDGQHPCPAPGTLIDLWSRRSIP